MEKSQTPEEIEARKKQLGHLWWLIDAPLFIDTDLTTRFHDAIIHPDWKVTTKEKSASINRSQEAAAEMTIGVEAKGPTLLSFLGIDAKVSGSAKGGIKANSDKARANQVAFEKIDNAERKLLEIVGFYLEQLPGKVLTANFPNESSPKPLERIEELNQSLRNAPRPLIFIDIHPKTPIIPTVSESIDGKFTLIFDNISKHLWAKEEQKDAPTYPSDKNNTADNRQEYWTKMSTRYDSRVAMMELEHAGQQFGRFDWVDFRVMAGNNGETYHLHCCPKGAYSTGTFGYNFVRRGFNHGTRIVGTLREGNAVNVLAIYER